MARARQRKRDQVGCEPVTYGPDGNGFPKLHMRSIPVSAEIGDRNRSGQILIEKTSQRGNHRLGRIWKLHCPDKRRHKNGKDFYYGANGCDFHDLPKRRQGI